ncbi:MAG: transposase, partial [Bacteroidales bacterium]|nr:transposase [Bacteroidales bacterium]
VDSFKIRASHSLKKNFNEKKLLHHLEYIDNQIRNYEEQLERNDQEEERKEIESKIENAKSKSFDALRFDLYPNYSTIIVLKNRFYTNSR